MTDTHPRQPAQRGHATPWITAATLVAVAASMAPWGTIGRLTVAAMFAIAVVALVHQHGRQDSRAWTVGAAIAFIIISWLHVVLTSPSVAWAVDSHMMPWLPLPGATPRIIIAWSCTLAWTTLTATAAFQIPRTRPRRTAIMLLGAVGMLPLFNPDAFPTDGYELLWNRSTFTHPTCSAALLALVAATAALHLRPDDAPATEPGHRDLPPGSTSPPHHR